MLVSLDTLLHHALINKYAIPAFNINFLEQAMAVIDAASETQSPVIIQFSKGGLDYAPTWFFKSVLNYAKESALPIVIHRDHCHSMEEIEQALFLGFNSIMVDGTLTPEGKPRTFKENIAFTQAAMAIKPHDVCIEAELGCLGSLETQKASKEDGSGAIGKLKRNQMLTDPIQAKEFVSATNISALAIAIGTSHGAYKFKTPPSDETLDIDRVKAIAKEIPNTPLVLHGSSSVPKSLCDIINTHGGEIPETYGVPLLAIQKAIQQGVTKVNIDTDLRLAATAAIRHTLSTSNTFDPRAYLKPAYAMMKSVCIERYQAFGSENQAPGLHHETTRA
jgi:fructose-bisphosphate aldolase class II